MKELLLKAKSLLTEGKLEESFTLIKKITHAIKNDRVLCPSCEFELSKNETSYTECPKCGSMWGENKIELTKCEDLEMDKQEVYKKLWDLWMSGDKDIYGWDLNHFEMTGYLRKSLADKLNLTEEMQKKISGEAQKWVSAKIKYLVENEGKTQKQAAGQAYGMARQKGYKVPLKKEDILLVMLDIMKSGESPDIINRNAITKLEAYNDISENALIAVYNKLGLNYDEMKKETEVVKSEEKKDAKETCEKCGLIKGDTCKCMTSV